MIKVKILPDMKEIVLDKKSVCVKELLDKLDISDPESVAIVVNNRLVEDLGQCISEDDRVIVIRQATGG